MNDPFKAHYVFIIEAIRARFESTGNPFLVWMAYQQCRLGGIPFPEWVLDYLDRAAGEINAIVLGWSEWSLDHKEIEVTRDKLPRLVAKAFGFRTKGAGTAVARLKKINAAIHMASLAQDRMWSGEAQESSFLATAQELEVSEDTVRRAWQKHRREVAPQ